MRRRNFIAGLAVAAATPLVVRAQQTVPVIGYLNGLSAADRPHLGEAFRQGLNLAGYADGRNVTIDHRYADNRMDRLRAHAAELIERRVAVIVATGGNNPGLVAKSLTSTIPIVFTSGVDPVKAGLVASLGRPEANVTGVSFFAVDLGPKHIELLRELVPGAGLFALVLNRNNPESGHYEHLVAEAARAFNLSLKVLDARTTGEIDDAFAGLAQARANGVLVGPDPFFSARRAQIVGLAARHAVPAVYGNREFTEIGGLISHGNSIAEAYRRAGILTGRILKGAKPEDLPIERATKFELVVNLSTARALGLELPLSLQMRIDEVIE